MRKSTLLIISLFIGVVYAQQPRQWSAAEIYQKINKLDVMGNVLYLAAHPDDENTRFISYCANEKLYNTAYLSLTRGDGGQNLVGPEIREELGIIRTQELLAARRTDGGQQFFTRANDFGYSKTPDETLDIWDKEKILGDVVWVIRKFRPDVMVCRFPTDGGGGHGHHTASALLAAEAFDLAGDKTKYPEQLKYVEVWQPLRVVVNTGRWWNDKISADDPGVVAEDIGVYNELLGISYNELAARSRTMHKSQGFGSTGSRGELEEFFEHLKGTEAEKSLFEGISQDRWKSKQIPQIISALKHNFKVDDPAAVVPLLIGLRLEIEKMSDPFWKKIKLAEVNELLKQCLGLYVEAKADDFSKTVGDSLLVDIAVICRAANAPEITLTSVRSIQLRMAKEMTPEVLSANKEKNIKEGLVLPIIPVTQPYWLREEGTLGTYKVEDQTLIGKPENDPAIMFTASFMIKGQKMDIDFPLIYKWNDPVKGELYRPFIVTPKVTANMNQPIYLFSSTEPQTVEMVVKSHSDVQDGEVKINLPKGWQAEYDGKFSLAKKSDELKLKVILTPESKPENGVLEVWINGEKAKAINTIPYDHLPTQVWFPEASSKLVYVDIKKQGKKIGYLLGAGDVVPDALRNIGYEVDVLEESDLTMENLAQYDAILTGIRFFNVEERSPYMAPKLMKYVENGGNLIVQYNTRHQMKTQEFGPYPITLSRDRVTEEDAEVTFLKADHPVLNTPNKITKVDFEYWVQERGLYFPSEWDENYTPLLSWHDQGEEAKTGSLLVAKYGKGNYAYSGISFFRELPAGVPGAYRLLVNLIEMR